jgi:predicted CXXCH cytochrome family protein
MAVLFFRMLCPKRILLSLMSFVFLVLFLLPMDFYAQVDHSVYKKYRECLECHPTALPTHRRNRPSAMSEDLPLGADGRMVCLTCHECIRGACTLRKASPELCMVCHDCNKGMACLIGTAHMGASSNIETLALEDCLSCHDGSIGQIKGGSGDHSVEVMYVASKERALRPINDRRVVLVNGMVTCLSCHNPYKTGTKRLIKSNEESRLCLTCHIK